MLELVFEVIFQGIFELIGEAFGRYILKALLWLLFFGVMAGSFYLWWQARG